MRFVKALCCAAVLTAVIAPGARADEWNKKTILTFSGPVQIPGATLPAGAYVFKLADIPGNRHVVQVFSKDDVHSAMSSSTSSWERARISATCSAWRSPPWRSRSCRCCRPRSC